MGTHKINDYAAQIYYNNKAFFDFIIQNIPDEKSAFLGMVENRIIEKKWVSCSKNKYVLRFLTPELDEIIPKGHANSDLNKRESFAILIHFPDYHTNKVRIQVMLYGADKEAADIIKPVLDRIGGHNKGEKYISYFINDVDEDGELIYNKDEKEIESKINTIIEKAEKIIESIQPHILEIKNDLIKLNEKRKTTSKNV